MSSPSEKPALARKAAILLGLVTFLSFQYFYEGGGWNQNSRFDLLRAIVERHTLQIDAYHQNTGDKAHFGGHYYSDKAPGLVFLAVPFALLARPALQSVGIDPDSARGEIAVSYIASAGAVALPAALAAVCLFFLGLRFAGDLGGAAFGALVMCLGTPLWAYASLFWAHALVGACLLFAFASALRLQREPKRARRLVLGAGRWAGRGMGDGHGISRGSSLSDGCAAGTGAGMASRVCRSLARNRGSGIGSGAVLGRVARLSLRRVWNVSPELFLLRSEFFFVHAAAGIHGAHLSSS